MEKNNQKIIFIEPKHSISFAVRFVVFFVAGFAVFAGVLYLFLNRKLGIGYFEDIATLSRLQENLPAIVLSTAVFQSLILSLILLFIFLYWGHAVAGPLVRVKRYLYAMGKTIPNDPMTFREKDQLHSLSQSFQKMETSLKEWQQEHQKTLDDIQLLVNELELLSKQGNADTENIQRKKTAIKKAYQNLQELYECREIT